MGVNANFVPEMIALKHDLPPLKYDLYRFWMEIALRYRGFR